MIREHCESALASLRVSARKAHHPSKTGAKHLLRQPSLGIETSNKASPKGKIIEALKVARTAGRTPSSVHIPHDLELEMCTLGDSEVGQELAEAIVRDGPRKAFMDIAKNRIVGLDIIWDAASPAVE